MYIYLITQDEKHVYDSYDSHVIIASSKDRAKELAAESAADEGQEVWSRAEIIVLGIARPVVATEETIILSSFNAG